MAVIHFGVVDVAYKDKEGTTTTGEVAEILEGKYAVMQTFIDLHEQDIGDELAKRMMGLLDNAKMGVPMPIGDLMIPKVDKEFRNYLDSGEYEAHTGINVKAAKAGVSHRKKSPKKKGNPARPAFIDTGLYQASFRTWITK